MSKIIDSKNIVDNFVLGKKVGYEFKYNPSLLVFLPREEKRKEIGYKDKDKVNFKGFDLWNAYEVSYLDLNGKPVVRIGVLTYSSNTRNIVESKSLKLYLNSFNMEKFDSDKGLINVIEKDLKEGLDDETLKFRLFTLEDHKIVNESEYNYKSIDNLNVDISAYLVDNGLLKTTPGTIGQALYSNLLKSNCLVTHQPDWGSIYIRVVPNKLMIDEKSLLKYVISFRQHNEFHEQCIERIFHDLWELLQPKSLEVFGKYVRRGGLDINPYRISDDESLLRVRDFRNKIEEQLFHRDSRQ